MITLPARYNSISEITKDPLGAALDFAPKAAIALTAGSAAGIPQLAGLSKIGLANLGKASTLKTLMSSKNMPYLLAGAGLLSAQKQQSSANTLNSRLNDQAKLYRQLFQDEQPLRQQLSRMRFAALQQYGLNNAGRAALDRQLSQITERENNSGVNAESYNRLRARSLAGYGRNIDNSESARLRMLFALPAHTNQEALGLYTNLINSQAAQQNARSDNLLQTIAMLLPELMEKKA